MDTTNSANQDQRALWNGGAGRGWVEAQESLDRLFEPFEEVLVEAAAAKRAQRVLDIGCGTGSTTLAVARRLAQHGGGAVGIDISEPMIALARSRAESQAAPPRFICADAQTHPFEAATFDLIVSRFGMMFFDDAVGAFANLRRAAKRDGELELIAWRRPEENPFMTAAERAAAPFLPQIPQRRPDEPGQFAWANADRVRTILETAGWGSVAIEPLDVECTLPKHELDDYIARIGPLGRVLRETDERTRARIVDAVRSAFDAYVHGTELRFTAACWTIRGTARP